MSQAQVSLLELDDGILAVAFAANLKLIVADLNDRPNDDRTRKLTVTFSFTPQAMGGDLDRVTLDYKVTHNIAGHEGRECVLTPRRFGRELKLAFANLGTDARQPGFDFESSDSDDNAAE